MDTYRARIQLPYVIQSMPCEQRYYIVSVNYICPYSSVTRQDRLVVLGLIRKH